jgi:hypothetical protein
MRWVLLALAVLLIWGLKLAFDDRRRSKTPEQQAYHSAIEPARGLVFGVAIGACIWALAIILLVRWIG